MKIYDEGMKTMINTHISRKELIKLIDDARNKHYITIIPTFTIAECALYDAWQLAKKCKVKGVWRMLLREAYERVSREGVDKIAQKELKTCYELMLDVGDKLQDRLAREVQMLKVAISNIVINATTKDVELKKRIIFACWAYEWCVQLHDSYFQGFKEKHNIDIAYIFENKRQTFVYEKIRKACEYFCADCTELLDKYRQSIVDCETAIMNKWSNNDFLNSTIREAMIVNGGYAGVIAQVDAEAQKEEEAKLGLDKLGEKYKVKKVGISDKSTRK